MSTKDAAGSCLEGTPTVPVDLILQTAFFYRFGQQVHRTVKYNSDSLLPRPIYPSKSERRSVTPCAAQVEGVAWTLGSSEQPTLRPAWWSMSRQGLHAHLPRSGGPPSLQLWMRGSSRRLSPPVPPSKEAGVPTARAGTLRRTGRRSSNWVWLAPRAELLGTSWQIFGGTNNLYD
jgi:hypothetical protein